MGPPFEVRIQRNAMTRLKAHRGRYKAARAQYVRREIDRWQTSAQVAAFLQWWLPKKGWFHA
jgi:hypothetical protein